MVVKPANSLNDGGLVEVPDEQAMSDDPDANALGPQPSNGLWSAVDRPEGLKQLSLSYGETMQSVVFTVLQTPVRETPDRVRVEIIERLGLSTQRRSRASDRRSRRMSHPGRDLGRIFRRASEDPAVAA